MLRILLILLLLISVVHGETLKEKKAKKVDNTPIVQNNNKTILGIEYNKYSQIDVYNLYLSYSSEDNWDITLYNSNLPFKAIQDYNVSLNISKTLLLSDTISFNIGTQNAINPFIDLKQIQSYIYSDFNYKFSNSLNFYLGPYYANTAMSGNHKQLSYVAGLSLDIVPGLLTLQEDHIGNNNSLSGDTLTLTFLILDYLGLYSSISKQTSYNNNQLYGIMSLTYIY